MLDTLPGVYWMTYFGRPSIARIGEEPLKSVPVGRLERLGEGYLLVAYEDPGIIGSNESRAIEHRIIEHLGSAKFFDKSRWTVEIGVNTT